MYMTNQQFIDTYFLPLGYEQAAELLMTARELLQRRGTQADLLLRQVPECEDITIFFDILKKYGKLKRSTLDALTYLLGTSFPDVKQTYTFSSSRLDDAVLGQLKQAFPEVMIQTQQSSETGVELRGAGKIYRRSLGTDLQKLRDSK